MQQLPILLFKSVVCTGILFLYYLLFLRSSKQHRYNRWYLLSVTALGLMIPFISFNAYLLSPTSVKKIVLLQTISGGHEYEPDAIAATSSWNINTIVLYAWLLVSVSFLVAFLVRVFWIYRLKSKGSVMKENGYQLIFTDVQYAPFSFLNNLFWKKGIDSNSVSGQMILRHELCHIKERHTLDKLLMQLVIVVAWVNPFFWLIRKELAMQHEFIADDAAISDQDADAFARMILHARYNNVFPDIIHPFFHSSLKRRLTMLTKNKKEKFLKVRTLLSLPIAALTLSLLSFRLSVSEVTRADRPVSVVFDAGHGGHDPGATNANGLKEKDLNLRICNKLADLAGEYNIKASLTRSDDHYVALEERVATSEEINPDVFIAIHVDQSHKAAQNSQFQVKEHTADGFEVVVSGRNKFPQQSRLLASAVVPRLQSLHVNTRLMERGLVVVNNANRPAILIECGNIDDAAQMKMLADDRKLEQICRQILSGIADYQNSKK